MSTKNVLALAGMLLILGAGLAVAEEQKGEANKVQVKTAIRVRTQTRFMDQNGDGINDFHRDHDNDGIPNCQDPDWTRPEDGTGYQNKFGQKSSQSQQTQRKGYHGDQEWSNSSFRNGQRGQGGGVCDGTGPKGKGPGKGHRSQSR